MRIIDVCIPKFDEGRGDSWTSQAGDARAFLLAPNIFGQSNLEYYADESTGSEESPREGNVAEVEIVCINSSFWTPILNKDESGPIIVKLS